MAKDQKSDKDTKHDKGAKGAPKDAVKDAKPTPARPAEGKPVRLQQFVDHLLALGIRQGVCAGRGGDLV